MKTEAWDGNWQGFGEIFRDWTVENRMKLSVSDNCTRGVFSGIAALYWALYTLLWVSTYAKVHKERKVPLSLIGKSFYLIAVMYELIAVVYFASDCIWQCSGEDGAQIFSEVCSILYFPLAYTMGMGCSLGYGTLYTRLSGKRVVVLVGIWVTICVACILSIAFPQVPASLYQALLIGGFAFQLLVAMHTLYLLSHKQRQCEKRGNQSDGVNLHKSLRDFRYIFLLIVLLFVVDTIDDLRSIATGNTWGNTVIWAGFLVITIVANSWILVLLRPKISIYDRAVIFTKLDEGVSLDPKNILVYKPL